MKNTIIVYGSTTGNTEKLAGLIKDQLDNNTTVVNVTEVNIEDIKQADLVLFGSSTWGYGDLQDDFEAFIDNINADLVGGKDVAVFGCGDEDGFADVFCNAVDIITEKVLEAGGNLVTDSLKISDDPEDSLDDIIIFSAEL
jgi:flavodoxin I